MRPLMALLMQARTPSTVQRSVGYTISGKTNKTSTDRQTERLHRLAGIIFDSGSISIALSPSQSTLRHAKPKQNTLCRPFVAPPPALCWECSVGFSLRLFNSSHIFFIDFSTPAFLWSIRSSLWWKLFVVVCCRCCCYFGQHIKLISLATFSLRERLLFRPVIKFMFMS